jgi:hypothetical protein
VLLRCCVQQMILKCTACTVSLSWAAVQGSTWRPCDGLQHTVWHLSCFTAAMKRCCCCCCVAAVAAECVATDG